MTTESNATNIDGWLSKISDSSANPTTRLQCAQELRDSMEGWKEQDTSHFISANMIAIHNVLRSESPSFTKNAPECQLRLVLVQILVRVSLPQTEGSREVGVKLLELMLHLLANDNDDIGLHAVKSILDLNRFLRLPDDRHAIAFVQLVEKIYGNLEQQVEKEFDVSALSEPVDPNVLRRSMHSFKVLAECPFNIVILMQLHRNSINQTVRILLLPLTTFLKLQAPPQRACHEKAQAAGESWVGVAPVLQTNQIYRDFIFAQVKTIFCLAYIIRGANESLRQHQDTLPDSCVRLLRDCPPEATHIRKELLVAIRHVLATDIRQAFVPQLDLLLSERILLGPNLATQESVRPLAFSMLADFIHHVRADLSSSQLAKVVKSYCAMMHNSATSGGFQTMCAKLLSTVTESVISKNSRESAAEALYGLLECNVEKLMSVSLVHDELRKHKEQTESDSFVYIRLEKSKPIYGAAFVTENTEDVFKESRQLFRTLLYGTRSIIGNLRQIEAVPPNAEVLGRFFEGSIRCLALFRDRDMRDEKEGMDLFASVWFEVNAHVFQETWTSKLEFFLEQSIHHPALLSIAQTLFENEYRSRQLVALALRYFCDRLDLLGQMEAKRSAVTLRFMKLAFGAVAQYTDANESTLTKHVEKLVMGAFPLAAKYPESNNYFMLLKGLFRAIGGGQGKFELLYKEVLPLLPEMLESLSKMLAAAPLSSPRRDLLIELSLTVPVRLAHLLRFLHYLMKPLVYALQGSPELVTQGLRTLELMVDNLTAEFLDPALQPVLRELMEALAKHLKPVPAAPHQHSHTIIRILGKLGGRNRRLLERHPNMTFNPTVETAVFPLSLGGRSLDLNMSSFLDLGIRSLKDPDIPNKISGFEVLRACTLYLLSTGLHESAYEEQYVIGYKGLLDALQIFDLQAKALDALRVLLHQSLGMDMRLHKDMGFRRPHNSPLSIFIMHLPYALMATETDDVSQIMGFISILVQDILGFSKDEPDETRRVREQHLALYRLTARFTTLCYQTDWKSKSAGFTGLGLMTNSAEVGLRLTLEREIEVVRALLFVLKDMPQDTPRNSEEIFVIMSRVIQTGSNVAPVTETQEASVATGKLLLLTTILLQELPSQHSAVRSTAQRCLIRLAECYGRTLYELLSPYKDRLLTSLYGKPLRALPLASQIGYIDAMTYCLSMSPPLADINEDFTRMLQEVLGMAMGDNDLEDEVIGPAGTRTIYRQNILTNNELRVAYIKFFNAALPITDLFSKQPSIRQRVTAIYFKSLYSAVPSVKQVANDGLRIVLSIQSRLPKDLLQTGLRPILMNLADPKKLSVPGLEGLARLLELLTNYFKVEIGHKLLDHFRILADPAMLRESAFIPLTDNEEIKKLVKLVNIFHLLPSSAGIFLEDLTRSVVKVEAQLQLSAPNPFTEPLANYLNLHPFEAADCFLSHLSERAYVQTLSNVLRSRRAPQFAQALMGRSHFFTETCLAGSQPSLIQAGLVVISELSHISSNWLKSEKQLLSSLLAVWAGDPGAHATDARRSESLISSLRLLCMAISTDRRVDLVFDVFASFPEQIGGDTSFFYRFLYDHLNGLTSASQRNVLLHFIQWFRDDGISDYRKALAVRCVVTPLVQLIISSESGAGTVLDSHIFGWFHRKIWHPMSEAPPNSPTSDALNIELLHLCSIMVTHCSGNLQDARKDIIKCAWNFINSEDTIVKQCAYLLAARFFEVFDSPSKFILRALTGLLRPSQHEVRILTKQALDILLPVLPKRLPNETDQPQWAKLIRRFITDDNQGQHIVIYQMIVRHRDLFYPCRGLFTSQLIQSLGKLINSPSSNVESRMLLLDIVETLWGWEKRARSEHAGADEEQDAMDVDNNMGYPTSSGLLSSAQQEPVVSYLVRLVVAPHLDATQRTGLVNRALTLLGEMLEPQYWCEVQVKLAYFSRAFDQPEKDGVSIHLHNCIKVLAIIAKHKNDEWFTTNAEVLQEILQKTISRDDSGILDTMSPILEKFISLYPFPNQEEESQFDSIQFHSYAATTISEGLRSGGNLNGVLVLLKVVIQVEPSRIEPYAASLMRVLAKFTKEHIALPGPSSPAYEGGVRNLLSILEISRLVVSHLGDQRRVLLTSLIQLIEKSGNSQLCPVILDIVRDWILHRKDVYPTLKEKAGLVQKMQSYERLAGTLWGEYLDLVYSIYMDPSLRRTDLTVRLEQSFLIGCRSQDRIVRQKFIDLFDASIPQGLISRLTFVLGIQSWEPLADHHWLFLALELIFTSAEQDIRLKPSTVSHVADDGESSISVTVRELINPMRNLLFVHPEVAHNIWVDIFPAIWSSLSRREQADLGHHILVLFSKEYHIRQATLRPNVIQSLLCGIRCCSPPINLPPHLLKYLGRTFGAWHVAMEILQDSLEQVKDDEQGYEATHDALVELYADLAEEDMFYGSWRRRTLYSEANAALSFEQNGMWVEAQELYETAQGRSRNGSHPFSEVEFELWEDHWILAAQKLQQWDVLMDLARNEGSHDLFLECAWRLLDWNTESNAIDEHLAAIMDVQTPRRKIFEALSILTKSSGNILGPEFIRVIDDAMQLSLRKWASLPSVISLAHVPLLQHFQQVLELQEAAQIFASLSSTTASSLEKKSGDMKHILTAWRERLPNLGDDITIWSDLVSWRQHVFTAINRFFSPFITPANQGGATANNASTIGYRGYHETAWITNRFAHVARKHHLMDVCHNSLNKIYTLPNIEISEAFLKLREQARCYYQTPSELHMGMDVINNTNLMYFSNPQKAEFYTLKAMFFTKLGSKDDANRAFASAVQMDMTLAKAWAEWGKFGDRTFQENPSDMTSAASAVSCYLQAAGLYKSAKSRPLLIRILWLLSVDDGSLAVSRAFDTYKGEAALWYWITLVPQLLISLSHREAKHARYLLLNLAKLFPQALFFQLRTSKEEMVALKRSTVPRPAQQPSTSISGSPIKSVDPAHSTSESSTADMNNVMQTPPSLRQPFEYLEEIVNILKTAFPLLALTMETFVDQVHTRFKATTDEDCYRYSTLLFTESITAYITRIRQHDEDNSVPVQCATNAARFAANVVGGLPEFDQEVIKPNLTLREYISKCQKWRDKFERVLDLRPRFQPLDLLSHWLVEFHHGRWDDIEVPGQYLEHRDNNSNFVKISRVDPQFEVCRGHGYSFRRLTLRGHDGTMHSFAVQVPSQRHARREERMMQIFRIFNGNLARRKETRKRNITFHLPVIVPFNPSLRLLENDPSYVTMQDVYDQRCEVIGMSREEAMLNFADKCKRLLDSGRTSEEIDSFKLEIMTELMSKVTPQNTLTQYMIRTMATPSDLWTMRKQFGLQISSATFMTYTMCLSARHPSRFHISRKTGLIHVSEMLPSLSAQQPVFTNPDTIPFRLTPNMQHFLTPIGVEGLLMVGLMSIGKALTEPEFEMDQQLSLFLRDEVLTWYNIHQQSPQVDGTFRSQVMTMVEGVVQRAKALACSANKEKDNKPPNLSAVQTISNLVSAATNPIALSKMNEVYHAWF